MRRAAGPACGGGGRMRNGGLTRCSCLQRQSQQRELVNGGGPGLAKPGGTLAYVTCSLLPQENDHQIEAFRKAMPPSPTRYGGACRRPRLPAPSKPPHGGQARSAPDAAMHGTDGFTSRFWAAGSYSSACANAVLPACARPAGLSRPMPAPRQTLALLCRYLIRSVLFILSLAKRIEAGHAFASIETVPAVRTLRNRPGAAASLRPIAQR